MRLPMTQLFRAEWERYGFRFCCEHCTYHDAAAQRCAHDWPLAEHLLQFYEDQQCEELVFCKEFELEQ